jgi:ppGpp synthetase/RelA/SpoT-type nucleotidyltranferase
MTKGEINRIGDTIRAESQSISDATLNNLQSFRTSHKSTLSSVFNLLCKFSRTINKSAIITYRIKRFESIIRKLHRYPDMQLSRKWDIGGCRCIFDNNYQVYKLKRLIERDPNLRIKKIYDYIESPQKEGYRSLHLFVEIPESSITIEVQIRNQNDHNWATLVEITDLLLNVKLKEYGDNSELLLFHKLLSEKETLSADQKKIIADTIHRYKYFQKLSSVFSKNYIQVRKKWLVIEGNGLKYFLIETKIDEIPKITGFANFTEAEEKYFDVYKTNHNANIVLTHLAVANYHHISVAYSNYILTFHSFLGDFYQILENLIYDSMLTLNYWRFRRYYNQYLEVLFSHAMNFINEMDEVNAFMPKKVIKGKRLKFSSKEKEWKFDVQNQIQSNLIRAIKFDKMLRANLPKGIFYGFIFKRRAQLVNKAFQKKFNKALNLK